jgi:hypothetical protein
LDISTVQVMLNFGAAGLIAFLLITGVLVPGWVHKDLKDANEKLQAALTLERERNQGLQQVATTGAQAMQALVEVAQEQRELRAMREGGDFYSDRIREHLRNGGGQPDGAAS